MAKDGVATQIVDGRFLEMPFTDAELKDLQAWETVVACSTCGKKQRLINQEPPSDERKWFCSMNR